ncbi:FabD/lysophospholipase-like protein [Annulohypoxylon moriforme]|nr:FabD/lysophospholipase-like protein [Annulohypoxylon moriforme]
MADSHDQGSPSVANIGIDGDGSVVWLPIVLSLDGGGVRGLSSLYFLKKIMEEVKELEKSESCDTNSQITENTERQGLPLPCNYFDFIIGTSTGGSVDPKVKIEYILSMTRLIATMLGRLRMDVDDCIKQYLIISHRIFRPHRIPIMQNYSGDQLSREVRVVVSKFCGCHKKDDEKGDESKEECKDDYFRQYDYMEKDTYHGNRDSKRLNKTCKVAVTSVRNGGANSHSKTEVDIAYLFRSYDSAPRYNDGEMNPRSLDQSKLRIYEACRATTAAPMYFPPLRMRGRLFMDGGIFANNPSWLAFNEAKRMCDEPHCNESNDSEKPRYPIALVSIGTGGSKGYDSFSVGGLLRTMKDKFTDTENDHHKVRDICGNSGTTYFRFNVLDKSNGEGLQIGLSECKREKVKSWYQRAAQTETTNTNLEKEADENVRKGYRPQKYRYTTFNKIRDKTQAYFEKPYEQDGGPTVGENLRKCAELLVDYSRKRRENDFQRWEDFRRHPDPKYRPPPRAVVEPED